MKNIKKRKQYKLACSITCPCSSTADKIVTFPELPIPNSLAVDSFNQEGREDYFVVCTECGHAYTIEVYTDNDNLWVQVWDDLTAELVPDENVNLIYSK